MPLTFVFTIFVILLVAGILALTLPETETPMDWDEFERVTDECPWINEK